MLTASELMGEACEATGLDDFGSDHFMPLLDALVRDLNGDTLNDRGQKVMRRLVVDTLVRRLRVFETVRVNPEILDVELPPVVLISGLPRTGTTLLHNVVSRHDRVRTLASWELKNPVPPPERDTYETDPRIDRAARIVDGLRGSSLERIHWVEATDPDENQHAFIDLHGLFGRGAGIVLPYWFEVALDPAGSLRRTFEEFQIIVKLLLWRNPAADGQFLILKDPTTASDLNAFLEVFSDAQAVVIDRDPHRVIQSLCNIQIAAVEGLNAGAVEPKPKGMTTAVHGIVRATDQYPERVYHLPYPSLVSEPVACAASVLASVGVVGDEHGFRQAASEYLAWQASGGRATPPTSYVTPFDDPASVHEDATMKAYMHRFGIEPERTRQTG